MKKSLLALAVLGAFAGAASAQTSVTVYGLVDMGLQRTDNNAPGVKATWGVGANQSGSRIGFKGTEDLGGGLSAIFALENGFGADTGALAVNNTLFNRQAWVGVNSGFGAVKLGRQYTPLHLAVDSIDPFATGLAGNIENVFAAGSLIDGTDPNFVNNSVTFTTANYSGFSAQAIYGFGEQAGSTANSRQLGFSTSYTNGPINAVLAYHRANGGAGVAGTAVGEQGNTIFVGATYDLGVAKAHLAFAQDKVEDAAGATAGKAREWMVGASAPVGAGTVLASWVRGDDRLSSAQVDQLAVGYTHALSKRTNLYTSFGYTKEDDGVVGTADVKSNSFNAGIRHMF